jgi:hypothetical protein
MMKKLSVPFALLLIAALAGPAMAFTGTFTNADQNNNFQDPNNWAFGTDAYGAPLNISTPIAGQNPPTGNYQTLVFGTGLVGTDSVDPGGTGWQTTNPVQYPGFDIYTFTGNNDFTVGGGYVWNGGFEINLLTPHTFTCATGGRAYGGDPTWPDNNTPGAGEFVVNTVVGSTLNLSGFMGVRANGAGTYPNAITSISGGGIVNLIGVGSMEAPYSNYCNLQINNNSTVNFTAFGDGELETLAGSGKLTFTGTDEFNAQYQAAYLDSTTGFAGNVSFESSAMHIGGNMANVNMQVGDHALLFFSAANPTMTGGSITGGGSTYGGTLAVMTMASWNGLAGNVAVSGASLTLLGTTIAPSTAGTASIYGYGANGWGAVVGHTTAGAAGILAFSSANGWGNSNTSLILGKNGTTASQLAIAVAGVNQVVGVDFSQVKIIGTLASVSQPTGNPLADTGLVVNIAKGLSHGVNSTNFGVVGTDPFAGQTLTILTVSGTDLSSAKFGAGVVGKDIQFVGGSATVNYFADGNGGGYVTLSNIFSDPTLAGDINNDGLVDVADYNIWAANVGKTGATWFQGDLNGDGLVDVADYNIWAANVGKTAATPEPISMIILAIGGGLVALKRRNG